MLISVVRNHVKWDQYIKERPECVAHYFQKEKNDQGTLFGRWINVKYIKYTVVTLSTFLYRVQPGVYNLDFTRQMHFGKRFMFYLFLGLISKGVSFCLSDCKGLGV